MENLDTFEKIDKIDKIISDSSAIFITIGYHLCDDKLRSFC